MIIAQISDSHLTAKGENSEARCANLEACISHINALQPAPDIVFHTGDLTHDNLASEYAMAMDIMSALKVPLYFIPGNRDDRGHMRELFAPLFPLDKSSPFFSYVIDDYPVRLIALDTTSDTSALGHFCKERAGFLKDALSQTPEVPVAKPLARPAVIFMHHPPYDAMQAPEAYRFQFEDRAMTENFGQIVAAHEGPLRIICGHIHRNTSGTIGGVMGSSMTSLALDLRKGEYFGAEAHAMTYHVHDFSDPANPVTRTEIVPQDQSTRRDGTRFEATG